MKKGIELIAEYLIIVKLGIGMLIPRKPPTKWMGGNKGIVILVPGIHCKWTHLEFLANKLNEKGYKIYPNTEYRSMRSFKNLGEELAGIVLAQEEKEIILLGHSKGGIVIKHMLETNKEARDKVLKAFTLATPFKGSELAKIPPYTQFHPANKVINWLNSKRNNDKIINLYPKLDNHVFPNENLELNGAKNIKLDLIGHTRILTSDKTWNIINELT